MASKTLKIGIVMDPIESITPYKDSSLAMLLEGCRRLDLVTPTTSAPYFGYHK